MATATQRARLRADIGADVASLTDIDADDIYAEAGEAYADGDALDAYARVVAIRRLLASSAKLASYRQNESMESLSDVFRHLLALLDVWQDVLDTEIKAASASGAARFGGLRQRPSRIGEYPSE
ncbi:MAG TPA: hypothetical protein PKD55_01020 [Bellilinea sp.]|nr:hypothetical protein [Bellilinea sp.]